MFLKLKPAQSDWLRRAYDVAVDQSQNPEFAVAFASKLYFQTKLNLKHSSSMGVGIAQLPKGDEDSVDSLNPEESLLHAAERDTAVLKESGDIETAIGASILDVSGDEQYALAAMQNIGELIPEIEHHLFGSGESFNEIDSIENRFRQAAGGKDNQSLNGVVDEMINNRVSERAKQPQ